MKLFCCLSSFLCCEGNVVVFDGSLFIIMAQSKVLNGPTAKPQAQQTCPAPKSQDLGHSKTQLILQGN